MSRARGAIEDVHGHLQRVWPVTDFDLGGREVRASQGHDGEDGSLGYAVELMHVRRARGQVDEVFVEELSKGLREEFAGVVGAQRTDESDREGGRGRSVGVEPAEELSHGVGRVRLALEEVDELKSSVVVDQDQRVLEVAGARAAERSNDVGVN